MHNLCTVSDLTVDKSWTNLGTTFIFSAPARFWIPPHPNKKGNNLGFNLDSLDGPRIQKTYSFKAIISLVLVQVFCFVF